MPETASAGGAAPDNGGGHQAVDVAEDVLHLAMIGKDVGTAGIHIFTEGAVAGPLLAGGIGLGILAICLEGPPDPPPPIAGYCPPDHSDPSMPDPAAVNPDLAPHDASSAPADGAGLSMDPGQAPHDGDGGVCLDPGQELHDGASAPVDGAPPADPGQAPHEGEGGVCLDPSQEPHDEASAPVDGAGGAPADPGQVTHDVSGDPGAAGVCQDPHQAPHDLGPVDASDFAAHG